MKVKVLNAQTQIEIRVIDLQDFLARSGECLMGRSPSSGLVLESSDVSRLHGKFILEQGQYYFYDLGSANGSLVNGAIAQANHGYLLRSGDIVRIGEFVLMMQAPNNLEDLPATVIGDPNATVVGGLAFGVMLSGFAAAEERILEPVELVGVVPDAMVAEPDTGLEDLTDSLEFDEDGIEDAIADQPLDEVVEDEVENVGKDEVENIFIEDEIVDEAIEEDEFVDEIVESETINDEFVEEETIDEVVDYEFADDELIENETVDELIDDATIDELEEETIDEVDDEIIDNEIVDHATVDELSDADKLNDADDEIGEDIAINEAVDEAVEEREYEEATVIQEIPSSASVETQPKTQPEILDSSEVITILPDPWNDPSVVPGANSDVLASFPPDSPILEVEDLSDITVIQPDDLVDIDLADEPPDDGTVIQLTDLMDEPSVIPQPAPLSSLTESTELDAIAEEQESQAIAPSLEPESNQPIHEIDHEIDTAVNQLFDPEPPTVPGIILPEVDILESEEEEPEEELEEPVSLIDLSRISEPEEELTEPEEELPTPVNNMQVIPSAASLEPVHSEILSIVQKKYIVLLAHENQEAELIQLIESYQSFLSQCQTLTTTTLSATLKQQIGFTVTQQTPALLQGGYQSVNSLITAGKILAVLFARDFLTPQQTQSNDDALSRSCNVYGVLFASNLPTAEALIHSLQTKVTAAQ